MSGTLTLWLGGPGNKVLASTTPDFPVSVRQLADAKGSYPEEPVERSIMMRADQQTEFAELPAGSYRVEARLPGGRKRQQVIKLLDGDVTPVDLKIDSPAELWLAGHTFAGNVEGGEQYRQRQRDRGAAAVEPLGAPLLPARRLEKKKFQERRNLPSVFGTIIPRWLKRDDDSSISSQHSQGDTGIGATDFEIGVSEWLDDGPVRERITRIRPRVVDRVRNGYRFPPSLSLAETLSDAASLKVTGTLSLETQHRYDGVVDVWRVTAPATQSAHLADQSEQPSARPVAIIDASGDRFMAYMPLPWINGRHEVSPVELLYDPGFVTGHPFRLVVADPEHSALLSFLGEEDMAGATDAFMAGRFSDQIKKDMSGKRRNPLAAAAAAYVGMSFAPGDERRDGWSPWLANLKNWFPHLPDGAILYARDCLERAKDQEGLALALSSYAEAFGRGIPYFSAGVRQLRDGLAQFAATADRYGFEPAEIERMLLSITDVAARTDPSQCFTVLRLRPA